MKIKNLIGKTYGRLTVISYSGKNKHGRSMWLCKCNCGNYKIISSNSLQRGLTKSCGCLDREKHISNPNRTTHGESGTRLYRIWKAMKNRCCNPNSPDYKKYYGNKGVKVCDDWKYNYQSFRNWAISHGYEENLSIDRIDLNGNYEPSNCRWATAYEQRHNQARCKEEGVSD